MILEGIVTTISESGETNISPMGPLVDAAMQRLVFRPYQTSRTYGNLKRTGQGVLHVTDDVLLLAQAAIGLPDPMPSLIDATAVEGRILADACRWYAFRVVSIDDRQERTEILADVVARGTRRDFFGFNRAMHAVVEAAILATRVHLLPVAQIETEFARLKVLVDKTGGPCEAAAFNLLKDFVQKATSMSEVARDG